MLGTPKIKTIRQGLDARTGQPIDMAFDTDYELHMLVKATRNTSGGATVHGMRYTPEYLVMEELNNPLVETFNVVYNGEGVREWVCPKGVTSVKVKLWGGGGAGGGLTTDNTICRGGGGAGGQYAEKTVSVTEDTSYTVTVGAGGTGSTGNGTNGGDSSFESSVIAKGGAGGKSYENGAAGGAGSTTGGVGDIVRRGGSGSNGGTSLYGGAGGGAGGTLANGASASGNNYGAGGIYNGVDPVYPEGTGNGAVNYDFFSHDGYAGDFYGGGGSSGSNIYNFYTTNRIGGNGGYGLAVLEYTRSVAMPNTFTNRRTSYASADEDYVTVTKSSVAAAEWVYTKLAAVPDIPENEMIPLIKQGYPVIKVGHDQFEVDRKKKLHTFYDAMKIYKTGTLSIHKDAATYNNGDPLEEITKVTYDHNLGYVPMFAPFVDYAISIPVYTDWLNQYYSRGDWVTDNDYYLKEVVSNADTGSSYRCIKSHTSDSTNKPVTGANWATYWEVEYQAPDLWVTGTSYLVDDEVSAKQTPYPEYSYWGHYRCILNHTSSSTNKPETGANWTTYWEDMALDPISASSYDIKLNDMEDIKYIYGGVEIFNDYIVYFYATDTQLVLELRRYTYDWEGFFPSWGTNEQLMEVDVSVDFTIFSNRADLEYNLLLN
jgi:hypothetical protein